MDSDDLYPNNNTLELIFIKAIKNKALIYWEKLTNFWYNKNGEIQLKKSGKIYFINNRII